MAVYQIYKILFNRSRQGNLLSKMDGRSAYDKAQELLEEMLGGVLPLTKEKRDKTLVPLESYVEKKRDDVTVMVVCNEKNHKYREKLEEHELVSRPEIDALLMNKLPDVLSQKQKIDKIGNLLAYLRKQSSIKNVTGKRWELARC